MRVCAAWKLESLVLWLSKRAAKIPAPLSGDGLPP